MRSRRFQNESFLKLCVKWGQCIKIILLFSNNEKNSLFLNILKRKSIDPGIFCNELW